jgi:hypothetical protein
VPFLWGRDQSLLHWILLDIDRDVGELARSFDQRFIIAILPGGLVLRQMGAGLCTSMTHERVHEFRQGRRFTKSNERVPMIRHDHEGAEADAFVLHRERESLDYDLAQVWIKNRLLRSQRLRDEEGRRCIL